MIPVPERLAYLDGKIAFYRGQEITEVSTHVYATDWELGWRDAAFEAKAMGITFDNIRKWRSEIGN